VAEIRARRWNLADKGFLIQYMLARLGVLLNVPPIFEVLQSSGCWRCDLDKENIEGSCGSGHRRDEKVYLGKPEWVPHWLEKATYECHVYSHHETIKCDDDGAFKCHIYGDEQECSGPKVCKGITNTDGNIRTVYMGVTYMDAKWE